MPKAIYGKAIHLLAGFFSLSNSFSTLKLRVDFFV